MNFSLRNIFRFLRIAAISVDEFETTSGLTSGTIQTAKDENKELDRDSLNKICKAYNKHMIDEGFTFIDMSAFGEKKTDRLGIIYLWNEDDNPYEAGSVESTKWLIAHNIKNDTLEKSRQRHVIIIDCTWSDSIFNITYNEFLDIVNEGNYLDLGVIGGVQNYQYVANPQVGKETHIYFNKINGKVEDVNWTV